MFLPSFEHITNREYVWMVGDPVPSVGLWVRYESDEEFEDSGEYPIYQNTRGKGMFNSTNIDINTSDVTEPTAAFWDALRQLQTPGEERIDVEDCEWYEREFVNSLIGVLQQEGDKPEEIGELFAQAQGESATNGGDEQ